MIFESLTIENFRQYYGKQRVDFGTSADRNVTVVQGENGSGKTAFLNALMWCLYGTVDFPQPERLWNERTAEEATASSTFDVRVSLRFEEARRLYTATRTQSYLKVRSGIVESIGGAPLIAVQYIDENGRQKPLENPQLAQTAINQMLPSRLRRYFFFDGESIDNLTKEENAAEIVTAIRNVMGLEMLDRALGHLDDTRKDIQGELKRFGTTETKELLARKEQFESHIVDNEGAARSAHDKAAQYEAEIRAIDDKLRSMSAARELQTRREELNQQLKGSVQALDQLRQRIRRDVSRSAGVAYVKPLIERTLPILQAVRQRGEVPSPIREQFVDDLLQKQECICGRPLHPGDPYYERVAEWRQRAGNTLLEDAVSRTSAALERLNSTRSDFFSLLRDSVSQRDGLQGQQEGLHEALKDVGDKLKKQPVGEVAELETRRDDLWRDVKNAKLTEGQANGEVKRLRRVVDDLDKELAKLEQRQTQASLAKRRLAAAASARQLIADVYEVGRRDARQDIEDYVNRIFQTFVRKDYSVELTDDYAMRVRKVGGDELAGSVPLSQGERQIASLAFISGLVAIGRQRAAAQAHFFKGGVFPIVMDSPFGTLDKQYRRNVAIGLPALADQVIVLASSSQWEGEVEESMAERVAKVYRLDNNGKYPEYTTIEVVKS